MKRIAIALFSVLFLVLSSGCKNDSTGSPTDGFGGGGAGGGGGTGNVTTAVDIISYGTTYYFQLKPSTGVVITKAVVSCATLGVNATYDATSIPAGVYTTTYPLLIPIEWNAATGQKWTFTLTGNVGSATGTAFTSTTTYTIQ